MSSDLAKWQSGGAREAVAAVGKIVGGLRSYDRELASIEPPSSQASAFGRYRRSVQQTAAGLSRMSSDIEHQDVAGLKRDAAALARYDRQAAAAVRELPALRKCN